MTESGKSTLISRMVGNRDHVVVLRSKNDSVKWPGMRRSKFAKILDDPRYDRVEIAPDYENQQLEFARALDKIWKAGGFTTVVDETHHLDDELGLRKLLNRLLQQGRDPGRISMVCGMQRPSTITRFCLGESTHIISFGMDSRDVKILELATNKRMGEVVAQLPFHHFAWMSRRRPREVWTGRLDLRTGQLIGRYV